MVLKSNGAAPRERETVGPALLRDVSGRWPGTYDSWFAATGFWLSGMRLPD
jgi:hypothetical protein